MNSKLTIETVRGLEWKGWGRLRQDRFIFDATAYWRKKGFPYYRLSDLQIARELDCLVRYDSRRLFCGDRIVSSNLGLRLANYFHPQMFHVHCTRYDSPYDTFMNDLKLKVVIRKSLSIWPNRHSVNGSCLRRLLKSCSNTVGVSNFRPTVAKAIIQRYSKGHCMMLDFSAGYGGRLLGAMVLGCSYMGIDPALTQVRGLRTMARVCRKKLGYSGSVKIVQGPAEKLMIKLPSKAFDLVFSSPPYFNREKYDLDPQQSFVRYPSLQEWLRFFLKPLIEQSARVLKSGAYFVINIADHPEHLANYARVEAQRFFAFEMEWKMQLAKLPYKRSSAHDLYKEEPVLVFKKR